VPVAGAGVSQAGAMITWPASTQLIAFLKPLVRDGGRFLAEPDDVAQYYLPDTSWRQWSDTSSITLPGGQMRFVGSHAAPYTGAISHYYFSLVVLSFTRTPDVDQAISAALGDTPGYKIIRHIEYGGSVPGSYVVWAYRPQAPAQQDGGLRGLALAGRQGGP
jgi:hypothetical protein